MGSPETLSGIAGNSVQTVPFRKIWSVRSKIDFGAEAVKYFFFHGKVKVAK